MRGTEFPKVPVGPEGRKAVIWVTYKHTVAWLCCITAKYGRLFRLVPSILIVFRRLSTKPREPLRRLDFPGGQPAVVMEVLDRLPATWAARAMRVKLKYYSASRCNAVDWVITFDWPRRNGSESLKE